jgi:hypothetical protein
MERSKEITCNNCGSTKLYLLTETVSKRKWRQTSSLFDRRDGRKYYFAISSSDPDYANNNESYLQKIDLICEACGNILNSEYPEVLQEEEIGFSK